MKNAERASAKGAGDTTPPIYHRASATVTSPDKERARQLTDVAAYGNEANAESAAADIEREFPHLLE